MSSKCLYTLCVWYALKPYFAILQKWSDLSKVNYVYYNTEILSSFLIRNPSMQTRLTQTKHTALSLELCFLVNTRNVWFT